MIWVFRVSCGGRFQPGLQELCAVGDASLRMSLTARATEGLDI